MKKKLFSILLGLSAVSSTVLSANLPFTFKLENFACMGLPTCNPNTPGYQGCTFKIAKVLPSDGVSVSYNSTNVPPYPNGTTGTQSGMINAPDGNGTVTFQLAPLNNPNNMTCNVTYTIVNSILIGPVAGNEKDGCNGYPLLKTVEIGFNPYGGQDWNCGADNNAHK